jgi:hypothetical protein
MGEPPRRPSSMSAEASDNSVVSRPLAVPALAPASGTRFMGAFCRVPYPDLTRLFDTDSLSSIMEKVRVDSMNVVVESQ